LRITNSCKNYEVNNKNYEQILTKHFFCWNDNTDRSVLLKKGSNNHEQNELDTKSVTGTILCNVMGANLLALLEGDSRIYSQQLSSLRSVLFKGLAAAA